MIEIALLALIALRDGYKAEMIKRGFPSDHPWMVYPPTSYGLVRDSAKGVTPRIALKGNKEP